jgi:hypothetical protein
VPPFLQFVALAMRFVAMRRWVKVPLTRIRCEIILGDRERIAATVDSWKNPLKTNA